MKKSISIVVPCKNEKGNIFFVYKTIKNIDRKIEILFGDDHSNDGTKKEIFKLIKHNKKKNIKIKYYLAPGLNKAENVKKGFNLAKNDIFLIHDADNTVRGNAILTIVKPIEQNKYDFVNCSRLVKKRHKKAMNKPNFLGNIFFAILFSFILKQKITDTLCGSKAFSKIYWNKIKNDWNSFGVNDIWGDFNLLLSAKLNNLKIVEIPIDYYDRKSGKTKMNNLIYNFVRMLIVTICGFFIINFKKK